MNSDAWAVCPDNDCRAVFRKSARFCPRCGMTVGSNFADLEGDVAEPLNVSAGPTRQLEIDTGQPRRWGSFIAYSAFFLLVAGTLVTLFFRFTGSMRMAITLVTFMLAYMLVMGWLAGRNPDHRE